ncbi:hypothetical protein Gotri_025167 [Gossypium trilobum]|uniref:Uncharacterized protein n=1 Tax=Gossypium trilobum TaxID=34281 RepID=A0A7J9FR66_9ROSI|nr:hypothetical protein [Gossypium trilobum]
MEELKWKFFHRLFRPKQPNGVELDPAMKAMEDLEQDARRCYWDNAEQHSKDKFVRMMLVDGCFIVELLRELKHNNFQCAPSVQRWMLPTLRRDLIMLENQLPLFVLQKLFELTKRSEESSTCLEQLALCFFNPLLQSQRGVRAVNAQGIQNRLHFLDLFRQSILPFPINLSQGLKTSKTSDSSNAAEEGIDMVRSMTELMEAGVVIEKAVNCPPLDVSSEGRWLKVPPLYIDDHKGTLFRNMVAYEQCHPNRWHLQDSNDELRDAESAWLCVKHVKSNAIVTSKVRQPLGQPREVCESGIGVIAERLSRPGGSIREMEMPSTVYSK